MSHAVSTRTRSPGDLTAWTFNPHNRTAEACPDWCAFGSEPTDALRHVAHRGAIWELPDRVELCVMQLVPEDPADVAAGHRPTLYFWSADDAVLSEAECDEMACAIRRAKQLLNQIDSRIKVGQP